MLYIRINLRLSGIYGIMAWSVETKKIKNEKHQPFKLGRVIQRQSKRLHKTYNNLSICIYSI